MQFRYGGIHQVGILSGATTSSSWAQSAWLSETKALLEIRRKPRVCFSLYASFEFDVLKRQLLLPVWGLRTYCSHISLPEFQLSEGEKVQENCYGQEHSGQQQIR